MKDGNKQDKNYKLFRNVVFKGEKKIRPGAKQMEISKYKKLQNQHEKFKKAPLEDIIGTEEWENYRKEM